MIDPYSIVNSGVYPELLKEMTAPYADGIGEDGWLQTAVLPDGVHEILLTAFPFDWNSRHFVIPRGFVTDYASVPRFFQRLLPQRGKYGPAAVAHDWLYWCRGVARAGDTPLTKDQADHVLLDLSRRLGVGCIDRNMLFYGVQIGGKSTWDNYRLLEQSCGKQFIVQMGK